MSKKRKKQRPRRPLAPAADPAPPKPARRRRAGDERPPAPWGSFPLVELAVLVGLVMLAAGFLTGGERGTLLIGVGIVLGSIGGLELAAREHFAGYRSHSMLLAGLPAIAVMAALFYGEILTPLARVAAAALVFAAGFYLLASRFRRKAGVAVKLR